jgi:hypothetical protein
MRARRMAATLVSAFVLQGAVEGAEPVAGVVTGEGAGGAVVTAAAVGNGDVTPWIHPSMPEGMRDKLVTAFGMAVGRVSRVEECRALFGELGADPLEILSTGLYFPANPYKETTRCRSALAYTFVGGAPTRLCRRFGMLSDDEAAMVVVHEALHHAGLTERPSDPGAMSAGAINTMVREACGF